MGMCDWNHRRVSKEICDRLGYPEFVSQKLYYPGEVLGELSEQVQAEVGGNIKVVLCATHDTASAVEAIDMPDDAVYVSSGTWALFGIRSHELIVSKEGFEANYSNEYGPNYIRYLTNLMGMWMVNSLSKQLNISVIDLVKLAQTSTYVEIIDVNDQRFVSSTDMINEINGYLKDHNQPLPNSDADLINLVYHSLAYSYNKALEQLEKITNRKFKSIYIVGGGAKNLYLNKLVEKYTNRKVVALPIEATSLGNIKVQMEADKL